MMVNSSLMINRQDTRALRYDNGTAIYLNYAEEPQTVEGGCPCTELCSH